MRDLEQKLGTKEAQIEIAQKSFPACITLIARGLVPDQDVDEIFDIALDSLKAKYESDYIRERDKLIPSDSDDENKRLLSKFRNEMQDQEKKRRFLPDFPS